MHSAHWGWQAEECKLDKAGSRTVAVHAKQGPSPEPRLEHKMGFTRPGVLAASNKAWVNWTLPKRLEAPTSMIDEGVLPWLASSPRQEEMLKWRQKLVKVMPQYNPSRKQIPGRALASF